MKTLHRDWKSSGSRNKTQFLVFLSRCGLFRERKIHFVYFCFTGRLQPRNQFYSLNLGELTGNGCLSRKPPLSSDYSNHHIEIDSLMWDFCQRHLRFCFLEFGFDFLNDVFHFSCIRVSLTDPGPGSKNPDSIRNYHILFSWCRCCIADAEIGIDMNKLEICLSNGELKYLCSVCQLAM